MNDYTISNWYWLVGDDATRVYSSAAAAYLTVTDETYLAWLGAGLHQPTWVHDETALAQVFVDGYPAGWPALAAHPTLLTPLEFMARFTPAEQTALAAAAQSNATILLFMLQMAAATTIDLTSPLTQEGVQGLGTAGLIAEGRAATIMTP